MSEIFININTKLDFMKIVDYTVVVNHNNGDNEYEFVDEVRARMKEGYQPIGGISLAVGKNPETGDEYYIFSQALVQYE